MKNFCALALIAVSASANSFTKLVNFNFDQYFEKVETERPALKGSYTYEYDLEVPDFGEGTGLSYSYTGDLSA